MDFSLLKLISYYLATGMAAEHTTSILTQQKITSMKSVNLYKNYGKFAESSKKMWLDPILHTSVTLIKEQLNCDRVNIWLNDKFTEEL